MPYQDQRKKSWRWKIGEYNFKYIGNVTIAFFFLFCPVIAVRCHLSVATADDT